MEEVLLLAFFSFSDETTAQGEELEAPSVEHLHLLIHLDVAEDLQAEDPQVGEVERLEDMTEIETETDITRRTPEIWRDGHVKITLTGTTEARRICGIHVENLHLADPNLLWQRLLFRRDFLKIKRLKIQETFEIVGTEM